jgi:hypothetical protein
MFQNYKTAARHILETELFSHRIVYLPTGRFSIIFD